MNKYKFYRVEHIGLGYDDEYPVRVNLGPYATLKLLSYNKKLDYMHEYKKLSEYMLKHEPMNSNPKKKKFANIGLFSTFKDSRPGPREDPYLRDKLSISTQSMFKNLHVYGFDSIEQLNNWFSDSDERKQLHICDFAIGVYYVSERVVGLRQTVSFKNKIINFLNYTPLI